MPVPTPPLRFRRGLPTHEQGCGQVRRSGSTGGQGRDRDGHRGKRRRGGGGGGRGQLSPPAPRRHETYLERRRPVQARVGGEEGSQGRWQRRPAGSRDVEHKC